MNRNVFSIGLFTLIMGYPVAYACNHNKTQGTWKLVAVTANPNPEFGLQPFPEDITITSMGKSEGTLTIKLPAQSGVKIYPFSQTQSKIKKSVQTYYVDTEHEFTHREIATTSCSGNTLQVDLIWKNMDEEETALGTTSSYTLVLNGVELNFTRINEEQKAFKALYLLQQ